MNIEELQAALDVAIRASEEAWAITEAADLRHAHWQAKLAGLEVECERAMTALDAEKKRQQKSILFVDFDGVLHPLNSGKTFTCAPALWQILECVPDLRVVVSSSWREHQSMERMTTLMTQGGGEYLASRIVGKTPQVANTERGKECEQWLRDNAMGAVKWAIIDDDPLLFNDYRNRVLFTDSHVGLTARSAQRVIDFFYV